jgi:hypothetical protein
MGVFTTIRPSSQYPETYAGFPEDMDDWSCEFWKEYYKRNKEIVGQEQAMFLLSSDAERVGAFAELGWCKYDCGWIDYMNSEGASIENFYTSTYCGATAITDNALAIVENITKGGAKVTQFSSYLIPIAIIGGGLYLAEKQGYLKKYIKQ